MISEKMKKIILKQEYEIDDRYWNDFNKRLLDGELTGEEAYEELEEYLLLTEERDKELYKE